MKVKIWNNRVSRICDIEIAYKIAINFVPQLEWFKFRDSLDELKIITLTLGKKKVFLQKAIKEDGDNL